MEENILTLTKVEAYKTSDDKLFEKQSDALAHEKEIHFIHDLNELVSLYDRAHFEVSSDQLNTIKKFIVEHRNELKEIFLQL